MAEPDGDSPLRPALLFYGDEIALVDEEES